MCFSATASFSAGVVLTVIGIAALRKVQHPSQVMFAAIPLLFAAQQISEGALWVLLPANGNPDLIKFLTYFFLFFAQVLWPLWVPVALLMVEKESTRKKGQKLLACIGVLVALYLGYCLLSFPVQAEITEYHVYYTQHYPAAFKVLGGLLYVIATIAPPFFSHIRKMWLLGVTVLVSYIISTVFYDHYVVSVWCFFASIISISVYIIMAQITRLHTSIILIKNTKL